MLSQARPRSMLLAAALATGLMSGIASADNRPAQEKLVHAAANTVMQIANAGGSRTRFRQAVDDYVAVEEMAVFALGKYRKKMPPDRRAHYVSLVRRMMVNALARYARHIRGRRFVVTGSSGALVSGYIEHFSRARTKVEWRVARGKIRDIRVQGIWLAIALRESFTRLVDDAGGEVTALIAHLEPRRTSK